MSSEEKKQASDSVGQAQRIKNNKAASEQAAVKSEEQLMKELEEIAKNLADQIEKKSSSDENEEKK